MSTIVAPTKGQDQQAQPPADSRKRFELLQDCRELVISRLSRVVGEALGRMGDELSGLAVRSKDEDEQRALLDAVSVVRQHRTEIELRFRRAFTDVFERRLFGDAAQAAPQGNTEGELALVDDEVLQARFAVDRLVHRARGKLDPDEVLGVRARFGALIERDWFDEQKHPAAPEAIFEALKVALDELAPQKQVQAALLEAFEPHVSANLNLVYSSVNDRLKANQVLPRIRPQVEVSAAQSRAAGAKGDAADRTHPDDAASARATSEHRAQGTGTGGAGTAAQAAAAREIESVLAQLATGSAGSRASATRLLSDPDTFAVADLPIPSVEPPLLEALSHVQSSATGAPVIASELFADLTERAREKGSALDQLTVEIVSMVFDYIYADKRLADVIKQQLLRLQVVAIKAALIDRSFFARRQHPMRRLIDRISEIAADPDAELAAGSELVTGIEAVVEGLLQNFDRDLAVFDAAREQVERLAGEEADRRSERLAQITREAERAELVSHSRAIARATVADRIDPDTPAFIRVFLDDWWSRVLAELHVGVEAATITPQDALSVCESLIWSVAPKLPEEVARLAALLPRMISGMTTGLRIVSMPDAEREAFINDLLASHTAAIGAAKASAAAAATAARRETNLRMRADGRIQFSPVLPPSDPVRVDPPTVEARSILLGELKRGDSLEIDATGSGEFLTYRLAWISPAHKLYVLSRYPQGAMAMDRAQLAALFDTTRARLLQNLSSVDRAIESIAAKPSEDGDAADRPAQSVADEQAIEDPHEQALKGPHEQAPAAV